MGEPAKRAWSPGQRRLHWWSAGLVAVAVVLGWWMLRIPDDVLILKYLAFQMHKLAGIVVFVFTLWRLALRARHGRPPLLNHPPWQRVAAVTAHLGLYVLLLVVPALGYGAAVTASAAVRVLPFVPLPLFPDPTGFALFAAWHWFGAVALCGLAGGHAAAALLDHRAARPTLRAMWRA